MRGKFEYPPKSFRLLKLIYHLPNFVRLSWRLFQDERVPIYKKAIPMLSAIFSAIFATSLATLYVISPIDIIPDFLLPLWGRLDDLIVFVILVIFAPFGFGVWLFIKSCPQDIVLEHVDEIAGGR